MSKIKEIEKQIEDLDNQRKLLVNEKHVVYLAEAKKAFESKRIYLDKIHNYLNNLNGKFFHISDKLIFTFLSFRITYNDEVGYYFAKIYFPAGKTCYIRYEKIYPSENIDTNSLKQLKQSIFPPNILFKPRSIKTPYQLLGCDIKAIQILNQFYYLIEKHKNPDFLLLLDSWILSYYKPYADKKAMIYNTAIKFGI